MCPRFFYFHVFSPFFGRLKIGSWQKHGLKFKNSSEPSRDLFWSQTPCFWPWGIISDCPEGQEPGGGAVGGQGRLQGVKL